MYVVSLQLDLNHHLIGQDLLELDENEVPPEDVVFHRFYMNKTGPIKPKAKKKASVLDDDTGELLADEADDASDESDDEMQDLEDGSASDGEYDYDNLDAKAFEEEGDLLRDDSDVDELVDISDDEGMENDDDEDDDLNMSFMDSEAESADDSDDNTTEVKAAARGQKRKHGAKSGSTPFASLEEYEHLMDGNAEKSMLKKKKQRKHKEAGDNVGRKERPKQSGSRKRKSKRSE
jgi:ribosome biogenesis protein MAK21